MPELKQNFTHTPDDVEERQPWLITYRSIRSLLPMILWTLIFGTLVNKFGSELFQLPTPSFFVKFVGEGISILWLLPLVLGLETVRRYYNDRYIFSSDRLVHQTGRISFKYTVPVVNFAHVRVITVRQSLMGRLLNYGSLFMGTAGESGNEIEVIGIVSPRKLAQHVDILRRDLERKVKFREIQPTQQQAGNS